MWPSHNLNPIQLILNDYGDHDGSSAQTYRSQKRNIIPRYIKRSEWKPDPAAEVIEDAIDVFERNTTNDYQESKRTSPVYNINGNNIVILKTKTR